MIQNDKELKKVKAEIARLENAIAVFSPNDFMDNIMAQTALEGWKQKLERLNRQVEDYRRAK